MTWTIQLNLKQKNRILMNEHYAHRNIFPYNVRKDIVRCFKFAWSVGKVQEQFQIKLIINTSNFV